MMNVQTMRLIVDVTDAGELPAVAQAAIERWHGRELTYFRSSANHIFRFVGNGRPCYLRLAHGTERTRAALQAELDFVQHVASTGVAVANPIPSVNGALIEELEADGQPYYAVVFEGLQGQQLELDDLTETIYRAWGQTLARLHHASQSFPTHQERPIWADTIRALESTLPPAESAISHVLDAGLAWLDTLPRDDANYGLIHGDFELDNLMWDGRQFHVMDFDDGSYSWYAADIAIALQDVWYEGGSQRDQRQAWFLDGYADARALPDDVQNAIPRFLNLQLALKMARLLQSYATTTGADYPAWLARMWDRHQKWLATKRATLTWE